MYYIINDENEAKDITQEAFIKAFNNIDFNTNNLPENILEQKELHKIVSDIIDNMDEHYSQVILLYYYIDLPYYEISDILGIKIGTVKSRLSRAKNIIKKDLLNNHFNEEAFL